MHRVGDIFTMTKSFGSLLAPAFRILCVLTLLGSSSIGITHFHIGEDHSHISDFDHDEFCFLCEFGTNSDSDLGLIQLKEEVLKVVLLKNQEVFNSTYLRSFYFASSPRGPPLG